MGLTDSKQHQLALQQQRLLASVLKGEKDEAIDALKAGANVNSNLVIFQGTWKRLNKKLLHVAAELGHVDVAKILIQYGANVNTATVGTSGLIDPISRNADDEIRDLTPLHIAAANGNVAMVKLLIKYGANVNAATLWNVDASGQPGSASSPDSWKRGWTALHIASLKGYLEVVHLLLRADVFVNASVEASGWTALHYSAYMGHVEIVRLLLHHGGNPSATTKAGKWPVELTANPEIHGLLSKYTKKTDAERVSPHGSLQGKLLRLPSTTTSPVRSVTAISEPRLVDSKYNRSLYEPMIDSLQRFSKENNFFALFGLKWKPLSGDVPPSKSDLIKRRRSLEDETLKKHHGSMPSPSWIHSRVSNLSINDTDTGESSEDDPQEERLRLVGLVWDNVFKYDELLQAYIRMEKIRHELYGSIFQQTFASLEQFQLRLDEIEATLFRYAHIEFLSSTLRKEVSFARDLVTRCLKSCE